MKNLTICVSMFLMLVFATSCNNTKGTNDSNVAEDVKNEQLLEEEKKAETLEDDAIIRDFITNMYENHLYLEYDFLEEHCSKDLLKYLKDQYEYDGEGYAIWLFRTSSQDGKPGVENAEDKVLSITRDDEGWYHYTFIDAGWHGENKIKAHVVENTKVMMDDLKCVYDENAAENN